MATPFETKYIIMSFDLSTTSVMKKKLFEKYTDLFPSSILL
jgi:hypothetical protein